MGSQNRTNGQTNNFVFTSTHRRELNHLPHFCSKTTTMTMTTTMRIPIWWSSFRLNCYSGLSTSTSTSIASTSTSTSIVSTSTSTVDSQRLTSTSINVEVDVDVNLRCRGRDVDVTMSASFSVRVFEDRRQNMQFNAILRALQLLVSKKVFDVNKTNLTSKQVFDIQKN